MKALLEVGARELVVLTADEETSCLWMSAQDGHLGVMKALLEVGGHELAVLTRDNGLSCLLISAEKGNLGVMKALLEAGGREMVMLTRHDGASYRTSGNPGEVWRVLEMACKKNACLSSHEISMFKCG